MTSVLAPPTGIDPVPTLIGPTGRRTGPGLVGDVCRGSEHLRSLGVRPGDRVLLRGDNSPTYVVALLALARLDASVVLVDDRQTWDETRTAATRAGVRWLLHDTEADPELPGVRVVRHPELLPAGGSAPAAGTSPADMLASWWRRPDAAILWSSGTTGPAKAVVKSGAALLDNTRRTAQAMAYRPRDVLAPWLPFSHQYGMSMVLLWWLTGATLLISPYRRLQQAIADAVRLRATVVDAPPSTYYTMLRLVERRPEVARQLAQVRIWGVGGAPLSRPLADAFRARFGAPLLDGYGLTEVGNVALATPANPVGCGRPLPGVDVRITGPAGRPVPVGEPGEIEVRSAGLMSGYLGPEPATIDRPAGSWYRTNDLGYLDRAGNLHVCGRRQAVHRLGHTLYPESIERRAEACGQPVVVVPVEDERRGCSLVFVVCDPAGGEPGGWRRRLCGVLPAHEHPNRVVVVDRLPLTGTGKVDRAQLRAQVRPT